MDRCLFRTRSPPFPLPSYGRGTLGPGFPEQPHVATKGWPSYRAPAPRLTAGAPALPTDMQTLSQLVAQQVVQQLWGSPHPPPCRPPAYPPVPVTSHTGWAADQGSLAPVPSPPQPVPGIASQGLQASLPHPPPQYLTDVGVASEVAEL